MKGWILSSRCVAGISSTSMTDVLTRGSRSSMYVTSRWRGMPPMAMPVSLARQGAGGHRWARHDRCVTGIANAFRAESPMLLIGGQGALSQQKMGSFQDLPHVDILRPITKFSATVPTTERIADMISMAFRECYHGAPDHLTWKSARYPGCEGGCEQARIPQPGRYRASIKSIGNPADIERLADILVQAKKPCVLLGTQVWTCRGTDAALSTSSRPSIFQHS